MSERAELVTKLVREGPLSSSEFDRLHSFGWDSEDDLVTLTKADALAMLGRYVRGHVSADDLIRWAGQLEGREDIGFEEGHETDLFDLIFELATQEIHPAWNSDTAHRGSCGLRECSVSDHAVSSGDIPERWPKGDSY